jgi:hypothetical protein
VETIKFSQNPKPKKPCDCGIKVLYDKVVKNEARFSAYPAGTGGDQDGKECHKVVKLYIKSKPYTQAETYTQAYSFVTNTADIKDAHAVCFVKAT